MLREAVRQFVAEQTPVRRVREVIASGAAYSPEVWQRLTGELGLAGLAIPVEYGGAGATHTDVSVALFELGAGLVPSPLLASGILAAGLLLHLSDAAAQRELLPRVASGERIGSVAGFGDDAVRATGGVLRGEVASVLNGAEADFLLVPARDER